jgi:soluble lytic murein transglycosylase-like protein
MRPVYFIGCSARIKSVLRRFRLCGEAALALALFTALAMPSRAAEINTYRDADGRCIYVTVEDHDLNAAVKQGGVAAGLRLIEQRKRALPGVEEAIEEATAEQRVDPKLVHAVIEVESAWNPRARSIKGALGLMQLMPATAARFGVSDPFDAKQNVRAGVRYLRVLLDQFSQNLTHALAAYNAGEGAVLSHGGVPPYAETRNYIVRINALYGNSQTADASGVAKNAGVAHARVALSDAPPVTLTKMADGRTLYTNLN